MGKDYSRVSRVADLLQTELAVLIQQELHDPRLGMITLTDVEISRDIMHAKVYFTASSDQEQNHKELIQVLTKAAGFLRRQLAKRIQLRTIPNLKFIYDQSVSQGNYISSLIDDALADDQKNTTPKRS